MPDPPEWPTTWDTGPIQPGAATGKRWALPALRTGLLAATAVVLVAVLVARVVAAQRVVHQAAATTTRHPSAQQGAPFGAAVGALAPDFYVRVWTGPGAPNTAPQTIHLAALKGQPVVLNFWASWCTACREEAPTLEAAWRKYQVLGVVFLGIATEDSDPDSLKFIQQYGSTYLNGPDETETITLNYGVTGLPTTVFIDRTGRIAAKHLGLVDAETLDRGIEAILR
jgi:cytochrome c biogenesis protein CcmG/thiol:disulfide interchange protein DsbE